MPNVRSRQTIDPPGEPLSTHDYQRLSAFRYLIRCFLEFSEAAAVEAGLTTRQHQALLAIKGAKDGALPTIGYLATRLRIQHHSAVELVDRLVQSGLVSREQNQTDRRQVKLQLTATAERLLAALSSIHLGELKRMKPTLLALLDQVDGVSQ